MTTIKTADVRFVQELYPRLREDDAAIERYRAALDRLPPITIARDGVLVDGFHRWQAYRRESVDQIEAENLGNLTDTEIIYESIRRNATHGHQLNARDKQRLAGQLWPTLAKDTRVAELAELLSVSERSVHGWTKDARAVEKTEQQARVWDMWLDCFEQKAIAAGIGVDEATISRWLQERKSAEMQPPESRQHFDIWQFQTADQDDGRQSYFGALPPQVVENLLWLYTEPGQIIVDPFAGSGTVVDVAKRMGRRVWASDRRGNEYAPLLPIHAHNIADGGWPQEAPRKADVILLDPPYWQQAKGRYSEDDDDLGNCSLDVFNAAWAQVIKTCIEHTDRIAYIISPTQLEDGSVVDHATDMLIPLLAEGWHVERRIIVPYNTQQATGQQVTWARESKRLLKLYRDLVVMHR